MPAFLKLHGTENSGTRHQPTGGLPPLPDVNFEKLAAPRFFGKRFTGAHHKPSRNSIKLVGCQQKQITSIHIPTFLRACRALTALGLCCQPVKNIVDSEAKTGQHEAIVIEHIDLFIQTTFNYFF